MKGYYLWFCKKHLLLFSFKLRSPLIIVSITIIVILRAGKYDLDAMLAKGSFETLKVPV